MLRRLHVFWLLLLTACSTTENNVGRVRADGDVNLPSADAGFDLVVPGPPIDAVGPGHGPVPIDAANACEAGAVDPGSLSALLGGPFEFWATEESDYPKTLDGAVYTSMAPTAVARITFSADGETIALASDYKNLGLSGQGKRTASDSTWIYDLDGLAPRTLRLRTTGCGVFGELVMYGSGVPIVIALRGQIRLVSLSLPNLAIRLVAPPTVAQPGGILVTANGADAGTQVTFNSADSTKVRVFYDYFSGQLQHIDISGADSSGDPSLDIHFGRESTSGTYKDAQGNQHPVTGLTGEIELPHGISGHPDGLVEGVARGTFHGRCDLPDGTTLALSGSFEWKVTLEGSSF